MSEILLKNSIEATVSFDLGNFINVTAVVTHFNYDEMPERFSFLSEDEIKLLKEKIHDYKVNPRGLSGGGFLLKELQYVESATEMLLSHISNIKEALKPKERKVVARITHAELIEMEHEKAIQSVAYGFKILPEKVLREVARIQLGDVEENYTRDELPIVLATKQVTGKLLQPEE